MIRYYFFVHQNHLGEVHHARWGGTDEPDWKQLSNWREQYGTLIFERQFTRSEMPNIRKAEGALVPVLNETYEHLATWEKTPLLKTGVRPEPEKKYAPQDIIKILKKAFK